MINRVAAIVGPGHRVDLKDYDLLILVDIYKVCNYYVNSCHPCNMLWFKQGYEFWEMVDWDNNRLMKREFSWG